MRKDFALCFNDGYVPYASVTIKSIMNHMNIDDEIYIHILSDDLSNQSKSVLKKIATGASIDFYFVDNTSVFSELPVLTWSVYTWYRLLLPKILDIKIKRVLYLDCDTIVNDNLDYLFSMDLQSKSIAACIDIQAYNKNHYLRLNYDSSLRYICAGVLLMNLDKWRENNLASEIMDFARENRDKIQWPDQDAINYVCRADKIILPSKYGVLVPFFRSEEFINEHLSEMEGLMKKPAIVHYAGYQPWIYMKNKSMHSSLWWNTYKSLRLFPKIIYDNFIYFIKYWTKVILIYLGIIKPGSKLYVLDMYYCHPSIKPKDVYNLMREVSCQDKAKY